MCVAESATKRSRKLSLSYFGIGVAVFLRGTKTGPDLELGMKTGSSGKMTCPDLELLNIVLLIRFVESMRRFNLSQSVKLSFTSVNTIDFEEESITL